ncbi:histidine kinase [Gordonia sp. ABSL1-1]|uniref:sensor histidine kinase n=1 Tax=Gordonia sp. ABSL1-1 TaxID=3053923 RepID=UPI0025728F1F|nr:histidine kinase [Gordonia sp. ABSL1-1]MDL9935600.1 histidine kinase [Gordonia sp. ABSL1-1]
MLGGLREQWGKTVDAVTEELAAMPVAHAPAIRAYFSSKVNWFFLVVALVMYSVAWPTVPATHSVPAYSYLVLGAVASLPIALAWSAPVLGWALSAVGAFVIGLVVPTVDGGDIDIQVVHLIALLVLSFLAALRCRLQFLPVVWAVSSIVIGLAVTPAARNGWVFALTLVSILIGVWRVMAGSRRQLAARTAQTEAARAEAEVAQAQTAVLAERARIAHDLHDVVAHRMSTVVVMAQTARYRLPDVSDAAAAEFEEIANSARASLDEVRQLLGVLRVGDHDASVAPSPGLADIGELVELTRRGGADVAYTDDADHAAVSEGQALAIYRIVQESLANATKHAPGGAIEVLLSTNDEAMTEVSVTNSAATGEPLRLSGAGVGIPGMADRARAAGGSLTAIPTVAGGFSVRAMLPGFPGPQGLPAFPDAER